MFFIGVITSSEKKLDFNQTMVCPICGSFGNMEVYMTYMCFSFFFISIFKWNKKFFVKTTCCSSIYSLDKNVGNEILKGHNVNISEYNLHLVNKLNNTINKCSNCGYISPAEYEYCPKCGFKLNK